jgi:Domain of unknown function (DUF1996)
VPASLLPDLAQSNGSTGRSRRRRRRRERVVSAAALGMLTGALAAVVMTGDVTSDPGQEPMASSASRSDDVIEQPGAFRVECPLVRQAHVDPIVAPGERSHHLHDLFGNTSTTSESTYVSMLSADTDCSAEGDTAAYWSPALVAPDGTTVRPDRGIFYYRNRPIGRGFTAPFPRDFRMLAGGEEVFPNAYWTCDGEKDLAMATRKVDIPHCGTDGHVKLHVIFPSCWDGERLDSADHRSHVAYGLGEDGRPDGTNPVRCPPSHPVRIPQLDYRVLYPTAGGAGHRLSDGEIVPHADFWNTWQQGQLEAWQRRCFAKDASCRLASGEA